MVLQQVSCLPSHISCTEPLGQHIWLLCLSGPRPSAPHCPLLCWCSSRHWWQFLFNLHPSRLSPAPSTHPLSEDLLSISAHSLEAAPFFYSTQHGPNCLYWLFFPIFTCPYATKQGSLKTRILALLDSVASVLCLPQSRSLKGLFNKQHQIGWSSLGKGRILVCWC